MEILCAKCGQAFHTDSVSTVGYRNYCPACDLTPKLTLAPKTEPEEEDKWAAIVAKLSISLSQLQSLIELEKRKKKKNKKKGDR